MSKTEPGLRVVRGPQWQSGKADGGEGHVGTLTALLGNGQVRVLWDNGQEVTCKAGAENSFELRILDSAPVGVQHNGTKCTECQEKHIFGTMWRCTEAACVTKPVTLCLVCYVTDKHNIKHVFERVDHQGAKGARVKKRSASLKIRSIGFFPGAKVKRGKDWVWGDQDGSPGTLGEVTGFENVAPNSSRNLVQVAWPSGVRNSYRVGLQGCVDLQCVEETGGLFYYRDHLPLLDATGSSASTASNPLASQMNRMSIVTTTTTTSVLTSSVTSLSPSSSTTSAQSSLASSLADSGAGAGAWKAGEEVGVGDRVTIGVDEARLKELQSNFGGTTAGMIQCIGKRGEVVAITANKALQVKFKLLSYRLNPQALIKEPMLSVGDTVRIRPNVDMAKVINKRVGWNSDMDVTCGRVGRVVKIDEDGDAAVAFGRKVHLYAPACCMPVQGMEPEVLTSSSEGSDQGTQGSGDNEQELHQRLMKMLAQMVQEEHTGPSDQGAKGSDSSEMGQLFKAINRGDAEAVRNVCATDKTLLKRVHRGMTLLMVACHEAKRDVINALLDLGADVNAQGDQGNTALGAAMEGKKESIALLLLKQGADVHHRNSKDRNPVHVAAYNDLGEALQEIIRRGADVNHTDKYGDAPLHDAIEKDNKEAIDALMEAPSLDLTLSNSKGFNMLQLACLRGNLYAVEKILQRDKSLVDDLMHGEFNALQIAVTNDHVECARLLIAEGGASLNMQGSQGLTALHLACNEAYPRSVELLVNYGADLNIQAGDGNTPLHLALGTKSTQLKKDPSESMERVEHRNRVQMACLLLEKGAFVDALNRKGAHPLQCCRPDTIRREVKKFIQENLQLIKRKGGGGGGERGSVNNQELQSAVNALLSRTGATDANQCKQS